MSTGFVAPIFLFLLFSTLPPYARSASSTSSTKMKDYSVSELIGQLTQCQIQAILTDDLTAIDATKLSAYSLVGHFFDTPNSNSAVDVGTFDGWSSLSSVESTFGLDSVHGANYIPKATIYPHNLAISSTFRPAHAYNSGRSSALWTKIGTEGVVRWIFSPVVGLATNPLWGRTFETFGESVVMATEFGGKALEGIESVPGVKGTLKHFAGYSNNEGRDRGYGPGNLATDREWRVWNRTLDKASSVMSSYTSANGRSSVNWDETTMRSLRRSFDGVVVTDFDEVFNSVHFHHHTSSVYESVIHFLNSEVDIFMVPSDPLGFIEMGTKAVEEGRVSRATLERKAEKVLQFKHSMYEDAGRRTDAEEIDITEDVMNSKRAAAESVILLKNDNRTLPLKKETKIFLTGPVADSLASLCGGWTFHWQGANSDDHGFKTLCEQGYDFCSTVEQGMMKNFDVVETEFTSDPISDAVSVNPDVVVVAIGEEPYTEKPGDIRTLQLPSSQMDLVRELRASLPETKIVAVYVGGRPRLLGDIVENVDAFVATFLPGPSGGEAISNALLGIFNPSGRLPLSWPKFADGGRRTHDSFVTDLCTKSQNSVGIDGIPNFEYVECDVQFNFGSGQSYSEFEETFGGAKEHGAENYQPPGMLGATFYVTPSSDVHFKVKIVNTGSVPGEHVSLMFYETLSRSATPRKEELFSFVKTEMLNPGEEVIVVHTLKGDDLKFFGPSSGDHFVHEEQMTSLVKIGSSGSYCRNANEDPNCLPLKVVVKDVGSAVCAYSCDALLKACSEAFDSFESCINLCEEDEARAPWTWDHAECVERISADSFAGGGCTRVQNECRDVLKGVGNSVDVVAVGMMGGGAAFGLGGLIVGVGLGVLIMRQAGLRDERMMLKSMDEDDVGIGGNVEMKRMGMM